MSPCFVQRPIIYLSVRYKSEKPFDAGTIDDNITRMAIFVSILSHKSTAEIFFDEILKF